VLSVGRRRSCYLVLSRRRSAVVNTRLLRCACPPALAFVSPSNRYAAVSNYHEFSCGQTRTAKLAAIGTQSVAVVTVVAQRLFTARCFDRMIVVRLTTRGASHSSSSTGRDRLLSPAVILSALQSSNDFRFRHSLL